MQPSWNLKERFCWPTLLSEKKKTEKEEEQTELQKKMFLVLVERD